MEYETLMRTDFDYALADTDIEQKLHDCLKELDYYGWNLDMDELLFHIGGMKTKTKTKLIDTIYSICKPKGKEK